MADPRYFELWSKKGSNHNKNQVKPSSPPSTNDDSNPPLALPNGYGFDDAAPGGTGLTKKKDEKSATTAAQAKVQVRLDTPGGLTYSPSDLTSHNVIKRMFIPYTVGQGSSQHDDSGEQDGIYNGAAILPVNRNGKQKEYDFVPELRKEVKDPTISEARKYALSIDLQNLEGRPEGGKSWQDLYTHKESQEDDNKDGNSISGQSRLTTNSTRTTATTTTLASQMPDSSLPDWFTRTSAKKDNAAFIVPPSFTKKSEDYQEPWKAMKWNGHRAFERPSQRENEKGIASFTDVNGIGRAPSIAETNTYDESDTSTIKTVTSDARKLNVSDLFVLDPRITRPLRMVRRTDPRQVLLLCDGVYLESNEVASMKAAQAAHQAGIDLKDLRNVSDGSKKAQELLSKLSLSAESRGGIGILFCPTDDPLNQDDQQVQKIDPRFEVNTCKRLEAAPTSARNTERRAKLRSVIAALELANWEDEGFDKIVIGVDQPWIVYGITVDIWRWRHTGWRLNEESVLGNPGELVPDRDLWEMLDELVKKYEKIDCNVRFWHVGSKDIILAKKLAKQGALKDAPQRPAMVRWRKKVAPALEEEMERRRKAEAKRVLNHQGPTLSQVPTV